MVRWILTLVTTLCLLAAAGARPEDLRGHEQTAAHLVQAHGGARVDHRLTPFTLPHVARLEIPVRVALPGWQRPTAALPDPIVPVASSRGPPRG